MNFKELLTLAKLNDPAAISKLLEMYQPLLVKESTLNGAFDEDLFQELTLTLFNCIKKIIL